MFPHSLIFAAPHPGMTQLTRKEIFFVLSNCLNAHLTIALPIISSLWRNNLLISLTVIAKSFNVGMRKFLICLLFVVSHVPSYYSLTFFQNILWCLQVSRVTLKLVISSSQTSLTVYRLKVLNYCWGSGHR